MPLCSLRDDGVGNEKRGLVEGNYLWVWDVCEYCVESTQSTTTEVHVVQLVEVYSFTLFLVSLVDTLFMSKQKMRMGTRVVYVVFGYDGRIRQTAFFF